MSGRKWPRGRPYAKPYTAAGILRTPCIRCSAPSRYQWQICADGNKWRALCARCDVALNAMVLRWARDPDAATKTAAYRKYVNVKESAKCGGEVLQVSHDT